VTAVCGKAGLLQIGTLGIAPARLVTMLEVLQWICRTVG